MRTVSMFAGLLSVPSGAFLILMVYGLASMMDPAGQGTRDLEADDR